MLKAKEINEKEIISKWLKWIFELPVNSRENMAFRNDALEVFPEAQPPLYVAEQRMVYYIVYSGALEQLLVKLNWDASPDTVYVAGIVRLNRGEKGHSCLNKLIDEMRPLFEGKKKTYLYAKAISPKGHRLLSNLGTHFATDCVDSNSFRFHVV